MSRTVVIRGAGTFDSEGIRFGDGGTSGANAGMIKCGDTAQADNTSNDVHSYVAPGTYQFTNEVQAIGPPPACAQEEATGSAAVVVGRAAEVGPPARRNVKARPPYGGKCDLETRRSDCAH